MDIPNLAQRPNFLNSSIYDSPHIPLTTGNQLRLELLRIYHSSGCPISDWIPPREPPPSPPTSTLLVYPSPLPSAADPIESVEPIAVLSDGEPDERDGDVSISESAWEGWFVLSFLC